MIGKIVRKCVNVMTVRVSPERWVDRFGRGLLAIGGMLVGLLPVGCVDPAQRDVESIQVETDKNKENRDSLREAFRYLPQLIRLDRTAAMQEINYQLNTWSKSVANPPEWKASSLLESIPASLRTIDFAQRMTSLEFGEPECEFMLQNQLMKQIASWVVEKPYRDGLFREWLEGRKGDLSAEEWARLETTLKLFDWTVCNVGMDGEAKDIEKLVSNPELPLNDGAPVYRKLPWQTMMFGRWDGWERGRVFTQLCFSQGIDAVVLALPSVTGATENAALRLWCIGVPIGEEILLFEPRWGLPIPSSSGNGIATLAQAKSDPAVLRRAKLPGRYEYPVEMKDLDGVIALVDTEPFAVGRTMYTLERSLTGENRQRLSLDADAFEGRLQRIDPKLSVRLWNVPWVAHVYNQSVRKRLDDMSPFAVNYMERFGSYVTDTPVSRARMLHLKGQFESTLDAAGALRSYMDIRIDEETLRELIYDRELQKAFGMVKRPSEDPKMYEARVTMMASFLRRSKFDIGVFLAMANGDMGKPDTAIDWLSKRILSQKGTEQWHAQAHYLLGRNKESVGDIAGAIEEYKFEASGQSAGNRLRVRRLESGLDPAAAAKVNQ